jgi:microcystin-dependent protein
MDEDAYIGEIKLIAGSNPPAGWKLCDGAQLEVDSFFALYEVIGTAYGGDGTILFGLPNFKGRAQLGIGATAPGPHVYEVGDAGGEEQFTLTNDNLPSHNHPLYASIVPAASNSPANHILASVDPNFIFYGTSGTSVVMDEKAFTAVGGKTATNNVMPSAVLNYVICYNGKPLPGLAEQGEG